MATRGVWPVCSIPGCKHGHTWETPELAEKAMHRHLRTWVLPDGTAVCYCHRHLQPTFPCDETQKLTSHA